MKAGVHVMKQVSDGWTALHHAVKEFSCDITTEVIEGLVAFGLELEISGRYGRTARHFAVGAFKWHVMRLAKAGMSC